MATSTPQGSAGASQKKPLKWYKQHTTCDYCGDDDIYWGTTKKLWFSFRTKAGEARAPGRYSFHLHCWEKIKQ
jgi:hypothetical protein